MFVFEYNLFFLQIERGTSGRRACGNSQCSLFYSAGKSYLIEENRFFIILAGKADVGGSATMGTANWGFPAGQQPIKLLLGGLGIVFKATFKSQYGKLCKI